MGVQSELKKKITNFMKTISSNETYGRRIFLLGSSEFGPTNEPKLIRSTVGLFNVFGKQGTLIDAFHAIKYVSKNNQVYLVKTTGEHAIAYLNFNIDNGEVFDDAVYFIAKDSNEIYNDIIIRPDIDKLDIEYPKELGGFTKSYYYKDYKTLEEFSLAINKDVKTNNGHVYMYYNIDGYYSLENAFYPCNMAEIYFYGGRCGLNYTKDMLYNCLDRTYHYLESEDIDIIIPVDAFIDDVCPYDLENQENQYGQKYYQFQRDHLTKSLTGNPLSFMNQLIDFCIAQNNMGLVTMGVIGFNKTMDRWSNVLGESDDLAEAYIECLKYNFACCNNPSYSFLISVIAGDISYNHGAIFDNGYLAYAAALSSYRYTDGISNKNISPSIELYNEFSQNTLDKLREHGITCFRQSVYYNQPVVYDAVTAYQKENGFKSVVNIRMISLAIAYINELFQLYIGENMVQLIKDRTIDSDLHNLLKILIAKNIITGYDFSIVPNYTLNKINVFLKLQTIYTVKFVTICSVVNIDFKEE